MKTRELKIHIPEGQEIDWQESAKQEKIIFKPIDTKPRSWEEYCKQTSANTHWSYCKKYKQILPIFTGTSCEKLSINDKASVSSKKLAEAFLAMMQLMSLRQAWIGDWEPDWNNVNQKKAYIRCGGNELDVSCITKVISRPLSFPTQEMAEEFLGCFRYLLEIAKPLI